MDTMVLKIRNIVYKCYEYTRSIIAHNSFNCNLLLLFTGVLFGYIVVYMSITGKYYKDDYKIKYKDYKKTDNCTEKITKTNAIDITYPLLYDMQTLHKKNNYLSNIVTPAYRYGVWENIVILCLKKQIDCFPIFNMVVTESKDQVFRRREKAEKETIFYNATMNTRSLFRAWHCTIYYNNFRKKNIPGDSNTRRWREFEGDICRDFFHIQDICKHKY